MDLRKFIGERIKHYRNSRRMNQDQLAELLETTKQTVSRYENGERRADQDVLFQLAGIFGVSINDFFPEINKPKTSSTYSYYPVSVSAGIPNGVDPVTCAETIEIPDVIMGRYAGDRDITMIRINGDSMNKVMPHGSLIGMKRVGLENIDDGDIVVYSDGHEYAVKRMYKLDDQLIFRPDSTDLSFPEQRISIDSPDLIIHGKVVMYLVELD